MRRSYLREIGAIIFWAIVDIVSVTLRRLGRKPRPPRGVVEYVFSVEEEYEEEPKPLPPPTDIPDGLSDDDL